MGDEVIGQLSFEMDKNGVRLVFRGPQLGPVPARPAIGVTRDSEGRYHFAAGVNDYVYAVADIPAEIKRLLGIGGGHRGAALVFQLPSPSDLMVAGRGSYMSFQEYENARVSRLITSVANPKQGVWPVLPRPVYEMLVRFYTQLGATAFQRSSAAAP